MSVHEIRVSSEEHDPMADAVRRQAELLLGVEVGLTTTRVFRVEGVSGEDAFELANETKTGGAKIVFKEKGRRLTNQANRRCRGGAVVGDEESGKIGEDADSQRQRPG